MESLKLAVRTPQTRVALEDPTSRPRAVLKSICWTGGFLDGVKVPLSSDLTALIGGRGTGKSTVIESLRYALGLIPIGEGATEDHKAIVSKVLRSGTVITVEVETVTPVPHRYTVERVVPHPPIVRDASGTATKQQPLDVAGMVEVFGQHELAELAAGPAQVAQMLRRFAGTTVESSAHQRVLEQLRDNRHNLRTVEESKTKLKDEISEIPRLNEQVEQFKETDVATRLRDLQRLSQDEAVFTEALQRTGSVTSSIREFVDPQLETSLLADYEGLSDSPNQETLSRVSAATSSLAATLKELASQAGVAMVAAEAEINEAKTSWDESVKEQRDTHSDVLRKLHEEGLKPDKYLDTMKALDDLKAKEPRLASLDTRVEELKSSRDKLLAEFEEVQRKQTGELHDAVRAANTATGGVVVVRPIASPDRQHFMSVIIDHTFGARTQIAGVVGDDGFSPRTFVASVRGGQSELEKIGIRGAQAAGLIAAGEELLREIEELEVGHAVEVRLNISSDNGARELKTMDELSKGQKATALLLLLLGASTAPLIIDQPEDDLDNRFVYDGVVTYLRRLKGVRQIVTSTHNANVPVLGDAELIVALEGDGQHGRTAENGIGSLDNAAIRSLAENLLEGGPAAFNARHHLYGF